MFKIKNSPQKIFFSLSDIIRISQNSIVVVNSVKIWLLISIVLVCNYNNFASISTSINNQNYSRKPCILLITKLHISHNTIFNIIIIDFYFIYYYQITKWIIITIIIVSFFSLVIVFTDQKKYYVSYYWHVFSLFFRCKVQCLFQLNK